MGMIQGNKRGETERGQQGQRLEFSAGGDAGDAIAVGGAGDRAVGGVDESKSRVDVYPV